MQLNDFLRRFPPPGRVIFAKIWGSKSHNCAKPTSDTDFAGVYLCPTEQILSLTPPQQTMKHDKKDEGVVLVRGTGTVELPDKSKEEYPDHAFYEVRHFAELLLIGNPGILEYLFTERLYLTTPEWERLRSIRDRFISQSSVKEYVGYMYGQMQRLVKYKGEKGLHTSGGRYNEKWAYHIMRLVGDLQRICQGKPPIVWKEGEEQEFLMRVRREEYQWDEVKGMIEKSLAEAFKVYPVPMPPWDDKQAHNAWLKEALKVLPLPPRGDAVALQDWILRLRKENWTVKPDGALVACKHLNDVPPVVTPWQMDIQCPACKFYWKGRCANPNPGLCPFDGKELPLRPADADG